MTRGFLFKLLLIIAFSVVLKVLTANENIDRIVYLDVGQGDASFIELKGQKIFIDGGPGDSIVYRLGGVFKDQSLGIDLLLITHFHLDHYSGARDLIERYDVKKVYLPMYCDSTISAELVKDLNVEIIEIPIGSYERLSIGGSSILLGVLGGQQLGCISDGNMNNGSLLVQLEHDKKSYLFMGDAESEAEKFFPNSEFDKSPFETVILKAGHHCSSTSSTRRFLTEVMPDIAICSVGEDNPYGHPSNEVLDRFEELGIKYQLTSESGDIEIELK